MNIIQLDGHYLKVKAAMLQSFTPGVFQGRGVFETMLGLDGVVLDAALHIQRLRRGLRVLGIKPPPLDLFLLQGLLRRNHLSYARVRLMVWQEARQTHWMIAALPYQIPDPKRYRVCLIETDRMATDRSADLKSLDYALFAQAYANARAKGYDDALLLNRRGCIFEASRANIFWVKDRVLYTPPLSSGCLNGITRGQVMKQAKRLKILVKEKNLTPDMLKKADTAFLTNSLIGLQPMDMRTAAH